ncbi:hypothetical protein [Aquimarina intermedia]|uniref:Adhesin n=1 Tax=Aquimarina intermedia TaxID=350814 RepID=A0A5S5C9K2_9FLAO|nr:hypothetical protein [Aquimarina intermedia]TYP75172.1 hypothetical protein BD809_103236 [Aquimarina intermedia]
MKTIYFKIIWLLVVLPLLSFNNLAEDIKSKHSKEKSLRKEFSVDKDALLEVDNAYGNVDVTTWDENRIVMEIKITVTGNDRERVDEKLRNISVLFNATAKQVTAKTIFDQEQNSWWSKFTNTWSSSSSLNMKINYTIKVPVTNSLDLTNDYGSITLDKTKGNTTINCDYGQIIIGELHGKENSIHMDYTKNSSIKYMTKGTINADYSDFEIGTVNSVNLNADYTQSKFGNVGTLEYSCDYGGLKVDKAHIINGNGDYLNTKVGAITKLIDINADYGSITIDSLEDTMKSVYIKADYVGITIGYNQNSSFDFRLKTSYGNIGVNDQDLNVMKRNSDNSDKIYEGYYRQKNSGNSITINSSYGGIKLIKK